MKDTTITEAMAEVKTIDKRIAKKREFIAEHTLLAGFAKDPFEKEGGSAKVIKQELDAIRDLQEAKVAIRRAIQTKNAETPITVSGVTRTVADWLIWRRDVAPLELNFLTQMSSNIGRNRADMLKKGAQLTTVDAAKPSDVIVNVDELKLSRDTETLQDTLGTLDGQLSLKNATVIVSY